MIKALCLALLSLNGLNLCAQVSPLMQWQRSLGGSAQEDGSWVSQTDDGGYLVVGSSGSNNGDVSGNHGGLADAWVVKLDLNGDIQWQHLYGGTGSDNLVSGTQLPDGGWALIGGTTSNDGDVEGPDHGNLNDIWVIRIDSTGGLLWQKKLGSFLNDDGLGIQANPDGSFLIVGSAATEDPGIPDGDILDCHGFLDYWLAKLSISGALGWQRSFGGSGSDVPLAIEPTVDGGSIITGAIFYSDDGDITGFHGGYDAWIIKTDSVGNLQWQKALGGSSSDLAFAVKQASDGTYIVAGQTSSADGDVSSNNGGTDAWVVKLDTTGNLLWQKTLGGSDDDGANSIEQTSDGGFIVSGATGSIDGDVSGNHGGYDAWVVKLDSVGNLVWQKCLGGSEGEQANCIRQTPDGGFVFVGNTESNDGDVSGNHGDDDAWVVKLGPEQSIGIHEQSAITGLEVFPVPARDQVNVRLNIPHGSSFRMEVLDATGKVVMVPFLSRAAASAELWQLGVSSLTPGMYMLRLSMAGKVYTGRMVKE